MLAEKRFMEGYDIACVQEPYVNFHQTEDFYRHKTTGRSKAEVWIKTNVEAMMIQNHTSANYVTVRLAGKENRYITSIYEEPGGNECPRLTELSRKLINTRGKHLIAGDLNAHNAAWGRDEMDARGVKVLAWCNANGYEIGNHIEQGSTYESARGRSYIDQSLAKDLIMENWKIDQDEALSGHKYIQFRLSSEKNKASIRKYYDFANINWEVFKQKLSEI